MCKHISTFISTAMGSTSRSRHLPSPPCRSWRTKLLRRVVEVVAHRDHNAHDLVDDADALEHVRGIVMVDNSDVEHVDMFHVLVDLHIDNDMVAQCRKGVIVDRLHGVGVVGRAVLVDL
ncbi:hypothetical protein AAZX31_07G109100 [Glycine max]|nr:hypothetical protein GYH30_018094 [Glycine max]